MKRALWTGVVLSLLLALLVAGCAATSRMPSSQPDPSQGDSRPQHSPKADRNLSGFSLAFRQGYVQGCDSAKADTKHRDEGRYKSDLDYSMGWNDGYSVCRR